MPIENIKVGQQIRFQYNGKARNVKVVKVGWDWFCGEQADGTFRTFKAERCLR